MWTIGYGHTGSDVKEGMTITKEQADLFFNKDIKIHENNVSKLVKVPLTQNEFDALVSFEYNIGYGNFSKSTMLKFINKGFKTQACNEFEKWIYIKGKKSEGLLKRRISEKSYFIMT